MCQQNALSLVWPFKQYELFSEKNIDIVQQGNNENRNFMDSFGHI